MFIHLGPSVLKHLIQNSSLLGQLDKSGLLDNGNTYIEFGSGRGQLTYWLTRAVTDPTTCQFILVDKASHRHKFDNRWDKWKMFSGLCKISLFLFCWPKSYRIHCKSKKKRRKNGLLLWPDKEFWYRRVRVKYIWSQPKRPWEISQIRMITRNLWKNKWPSPILSNLPCQKTFFFGFWPWISQKASFYFFQISCG